jgi:hypothetical protein
MGSRMWGFTHEVFPASPDPDPDPELVRAMVARYPHIVEIATYRAHDPRSLVRPGCDDQFEFEFALDLMLDGFEGLHRPGWTSR